MRHRRQGATQVSTSLAAIALAMLGATSFAQQTLDVTLSGGVATDQRGARSNAFSLAPVMTFGSSTGSYGTLGANLTTFESTAWSAGGMAAVSQRQRIARTPFLIAVDVSGSATRLQAQRAWASFLTGDAASTLEFWYGSMLLFGGAHIGAGRVSQLTSRPLMPGVPQRSPEIQGETRAGAGPTFGGEYTVVLGAARTMRVGVRQDNLTTDSLTITDRSVNASYMVGSATVNGSLARRTATDERANYGNVALALKIGGGQDAEFIAAAGEYPSNRLTGSLAGRYLNAGLQLQVGRTSGSSRVPGPRERGAPRIPTGFTRLTIDAPSASQVEVAGDFNRWTPVPATRAANGVWYADMDIPPGQYRYAFRVDGREWRVPRGAVAVDDGFGGKSAWLTIADGRPAASP